MSSSRRHASNGFTLLEVLIVLAIVALLMGGVTVGLRALLSTQLRSGASRTAAAMRAAFQRAMLTGKTLRLAIDLDKGKLWLEVSDRSVALRGGAEQQVTTDEHEAESGEPAPAPKAPGLMPFGMGGGSEEGGDEELPSGIDVKQLLAQHERDLEPVRRAKALFKPFKAAGVGRVTLRGGVSIEAVVTPRLEDPVTKGMAYVYFFPRGHAESAIIVLRDRGEGHYSVLMRPLTGRAEIFPCRLRMPKDFGQAQPGELPDRRAVCERDS